MISLAYAYRCGKATVCNIISNCLGAIWNKLSRIVFPQLVEKVWKIYQKDLTMCGIFHIVLGV